MKRSLNFISLVVSCVALVFVFAPTFGETRVRLIEPEPDLISARAVHRLRILDMSDVTADAATVRTQVEAQDDRPELIILDVPDSACHDEVDCTTALRLAFDSVGSTINEIDFRANDNECRGTGADGSRVETVCAKPVPEVASSRPRSRAAVK